VYYVAYPQQVSLEHLGAAAAQAAGSFGIVIDRTRPEASRGPLDIAPAARDFGFAHKVDHWEGIRRMVAARQAQSP
jgi:nucleoside-diphosphate-sugar epimerase